MPAASRPGKKIVSPEDLHGCGPCPEKFVPQRLSGANWRWFCSLMSTFLIVLIRVYRWTVSPLLHASLVEEVADSDQAVHSIAWRRFSGMAQSEGYGLG